MTLQEFLNRAGGIEHSGLAAFQAAGDLDALEHARIAFLGDRQGQVKALQESLREMAKEDKPAAGKRFNELRTRLEAEHESKRSVLARSATAPSTDDLTMPARTPWRGPT